MREWNNIEKKMKSVVNAHEAKAPDFIWAAIEEDLNASKPKGIPWWYVLGFLISVIAFVMLAKNFKGLTLENSTISNTLEQTAMQYNEDENITLVPIAEEEIKIPTTEDNSIVNLVPTVNKSIDNTVDSRLYENRTVSSNRAQKSIPAFSERGNASLAQGRVKQAQKVLIQSSVEDVILSKRASLDYLKPAHNSISFLELEREKLEYTDGIECPTFSDGLSLHPFVEMNGLLGTHFKSLDALANEEIDTEGFKLARENSESSWYNWGGQFLAGLNVNRNLYFGTGLEWSQAKDKFQFVDEGVTKIVIDLDPEGNPIDTSLVSGMFVSSGEVRYTMMDIPVFVGLTRSMGSWDVGFEAAALFNLSFSSNGKVLNDQLEVTRTESAPAVYKDKLGMGLRGSVVLRKFLNDGLSFHIKPSFKTYLGEINQEGYLLNTKLNIARVDLGFRKDF